MIILNYIDFKTIVNAKSLLWQYTETSGCYDIFAFDSLIEYKTSILKHPEDYPNKEGEDANLLDFETNYKTNANQVLDPRSLDGVQRQAPGLYQVEDSFYIKGDKINVPVSSTGKIEFQSAYDVKLVGIIAFWKDSDIGDYIECSVGYYVGEDWIEIIKYGETLYVVGSNKVDISTNDYAIIPIGVVVRIEYTNVSSTTAKDFIVWLKCYR